jgi:hypothetical protein
MTLPAGLACIGIDLAWSPNRGNPSGVAVLVPVLRREMRRLKRPLDHVLSSDRAWEDDGQ